MIFQGMARRWIWGKSGKERRSAGKGCADERAAAGMQDCVEEFLSRCRVNDFVSKIKVRATLHTGLGDYRVRNGRAFHA